MAQEPKKKHSKARKLTRRAAITLKSLSTIKCSHCGELTLPHQACKNCGFYKKKRLEVKKKAVVTKA